MSFPDFTADCVRKILFCNDETTPTKRADTCNVSRGIVKDWRLLPLACLVLMAPAGVVGQSASDAAESRLLCVQGLAQRGVDRVQAMGVRMGSAEMCVKALSWTANNGDLLDIYLRGAGRSEARIFVNRLTDNARLSTDPFRTSSSPAEMWRKGELTPSVAFDAGFTRSYLEKPKAPPTSMSSADLQRKTEGCLNETQSLALCADLGRIQAALAYQMNNAFSGGSAAPSTETQSSGPDRAATAAAIDRKFQTWAQSWSFDRYTPGSAQVTGINCSEQCKASGQFSFVRFTSVHTIPFVAFLSPAGNGKYSLTRLCYNDETKNMMDCTN